MITLGEIAESHSEASGITEAIGNAAGQAQVEAAVMLTIERR